ncbi:MAG: glycoside hydrolase family 25 protein [Chitinophagaceae bacterium]|nr:glycoside hydrolase family 25 protein [Chitinophagaceae bacterium]
MSSRRKKKLLRWILIITVAGLVALVSVLARRWWMYQQAKSTRYAEFGISIPGEYAIHGIDVSRYQDIIAWEEVKAMSVHNIRMGFAFIKATEGIGSADPQFRRNWKKSRSHDVVRGAYHFFIASKDGKMQAENFIKRVDIEPGDLPPVLDVEQRNGVSAAQLRKEVRKWLSTVELHYGVKPIIYTNVDFYEQNLGSEFDSYPLWVAHYYEDEQPRIKRDWIFWQHNDQGRVNGIMPKVDFNVFKGDSIAFRAMLVR